MQSLWPLAQLRAAERTVLAGVAPGALMAIAARAIAVQAHAMLGFGYGARVVLLVGTGDNGGDALYAGAQLRRRGVDVRAVLATPDRFHAAAMAQFCRAGGRVVPRSAVQSADLVIDGLLGIGATGALRAELVPLVELAARLGSPVLAVDVPSGVNPDTGAVLGPAIKATLTLSMGTLKAGLVVGPGREYAGETRVIDIGLGPHLPPPMLHILTDLDVAQALRRPQPDDDKYSRGVVGIAAGSARYPGAALLAVAAARLGGVGAVRYGGHAAISVVQRWPEVIVTDSVAESGRVQAWVLGPGIGDDPDAVTALEYVLEQDVPALIDADGLSLLANRRARLSQRRAATVLTPHAGEFARFFPEISPADLAADRLGAVRRASAESGAVVLLKGWTTIVAQPDGRAWVNPTGSPALATAGSGDTLSGLIGSLLATGIEPGLAAAVGAYLHGRAGAIAAADGPVTAADLEPALRIAFGRLG